MKRYKVLHITNWYPSKDSLFKVPFIKEHFEALNLLTEGDLVHVEVSSVKDKLFSYEKTSLSKNEDSYVLRTRIEKWFLKEILSTLLLIRVLVLKKYTNYDIIVFHVGYPILTYFHLVGKVIRKPILIIEHWTAFHYNFNVQKGTKKLKRIQNIYRRQYPLATVSKQLMLDIENFSNHKQTQYILPNVVNKEIFNYNRLIKRQSNQFFMVNYWREIKSPFPVLNAFKKFIELEPKAMLRIGGYGPLWNKIIDFVIENKLSGNIILLGKLDKPTIAYEMQQASALLHNADYETFSVVCAEAICCGCPVIVSKLDAVEEFINVTNGIIVNSPSDWLKVLMKFDPIIFNSLKISETGLAKFDKKIVGNIFYNYIENICMKYT